MASHSIGSANVSFGLVSIPVRIFSSSQPRSSISFNMLHKGCGSRLKQQYLCPKDNEKVERDQMVKGYEFDKGRYVTFSNEELKAFEEKASQAIEIAEFVPQGSVDPSYFDTVYLLGPEKGGARAYKLLAEAMKQTGRYAIAKYTSRGKQYLVLIRPDHVKVGGLVMQQLHYQDELRTMKDVEIEDADVKPAELNLAVQLIEQAASEAFHPESYEDEVRKRLVAAIEAKVAGEEVSISPEEPRAQIIDLMEALKASLAAKPATRVGAGEGAEVTPLRAVEPAADERKPAKKAPRHATAERRTAGGRGKG